MEKELLKLTEEVKLLEEECNQLASANRQYVQTLNEVWNILFIRNGSDTAKLFELQLLLKNLLQSQKNGNQNTPPINQKTV